METLMNARAALLAALLDGEGYGLELMARVADRTGGAIRLGEGSVYPALRALERDHLLDSYEGEPLPERGGRPRRYYRLTAKGRRVAEEQSRAILGLVGPRLSPAGAR
jgi:PadR family transcriptional regulator, regulatory protein PadR